MEDFFYRKLDVYQLAKQLCKMVYALLKSFPSEERYALGDQLRRAVISVPSNIAEGMGRFALKERIHFLEIAYASLAETLCQMEISYELGYVTEEQFQQVETQVKKIARTMSGLRKSIQSKINIINSGGVTKGM